jgi:hypothetical protein
LLGISTEGEMYVLAETPFGELSGLCFSPDGRAMFLSVFEQGVTLVITGPFPDPIETPADPDEPDPDWGFAGAGGASDVPVATEGPRTDGKKPSARVRPASGCTVVRPGTASEDGELAAAVALGTAALVVRRAAVRARDDD